MGITSNITYSDEFGFVVSKEESEESQKRFEKYLSDKWEKRANEIVNATKEATNTRDKLKIIFKYLTSDKFKYVAQNKSLDKKSVQNNYFGRVKEFPAYSIDSRSKYPVLILNEGVCRNYSLAFEDLCKRIGVYCKCIEGDTGMDHLWNAVVINGEILYVDVAYALMGKNNRVDPMKFFLKTHEEIIEAGGYRKITSSLDELIEESKRQKKPSRITIHKVEKKPSRITIHEVENKPSHITIH